MLRCQARVVVGDDGVEVMGSEGYLVNPFLADVDDGQRHAVVLVDEGLDLALELLEQRQRTSFIFSVVMLCIAGISLLVGGIGIMNIMLVSVTERTKEIGTLRAIGMQRGKVLWLFVLETALLGLAGTAAGALAAAGIAALVEPTRATRASRVCPQRRIRASR